MRKHAKAAICWILALEALPPKVSSAKVVAPVVPTVRILAQTGATNKIQAQSGKFATATAKLQARTGALPKILTQAQPAANAYQPPHLRQPPSPLKIASGHKYPGQ